MSNRDRDLSKRLQAPGATPGPIGPTGATGPAGPGGNAGKTKVLAVDYSHDFVALPGVQNILTTPNYTKLTASSQLRVTVTASGTLTQVGAAGPGFVRIQINFPGIGPQHGAISGPLDQAIVAPWNLCVGDSFGSLPAGGPYTFDIWLDCVPDVLATSATVIIAPNANFATQHAYITVEEWEP